MLATTRLFWGKAQPEHQAAPPMHPVVAHSLDVAAVAILLQRGRGQGEAARASASSSPCMTSANSPVLSKGRCPQIGQRPRWEPCPPTAFRPGPKHDVLGYHMLLKSFSASLGGVLPRRVEGHRAWIEGERSSLLRGLAGHHGRPPAVLDFEPTSNVLCRNCLEAAADFIAAMERTFAPPPLLGPLAAHEMARLG